MKTPYKIILADDHVLLRDALANLINNFEEFSVVAKAANGREVIDIIQTGLLADILLMDLNMPIMDGFETSKLLAEQQPHLKKVILTMYDTEMMLMRLLKTGVCGFLKKDIHPKELQNALLAIAAGEYYYSNHTTLNMISIFKKTESSPASFEKLLLTDHEIDFLKMCITEMTYVDIAQAMQLQPKYIDSIRQALFLRLQVKSRIGLAIYAVRNGLVTF